MKVGLLGGSFNPPHQGHVHISYLAIKRLGLNQVWWIPTLRNPLKDESIYENYRGRFLKCKNISKNFPKILVKEFEEIYTEKLIIRLKKKFPHIDFFWIMGADNLENFHRWKNFKKLAKMIPLVIFSREKILQKIRKVKSWKFIALGNYKIFLTQNLNLSSSEIRKNSHE